MEVKSASKRPAHPSDWGYRLAKEIELRDQVKQTGEIWRTDHELWEMTYAQIAALGLRSRIADYTKLSIVDPCHRVCPTIPVNIAPRNGAYGQKCGICHTYRILYSA